jgi:hypothetical protein
LSTSTSTSTPPAERVGSAAGESRPRVKPPRFPKEPHR